MKLLLVGKRELGDIVNYKGAHYLIVSRQSELYHFPGRKEAWEYELMKLGEGRLTIGEIRKLQNELQERLK